MGAMLRGTQKTPDMRGSERGYLMKVGVQLREGGDDWEGTSNPTSLGPTWLPNSR